MVSETSVVSGVDLGDVALAVQVRQRLGDVEALINQELSRGEEFLSETSLHLVNAGGKRFRPLLTVLCACLAGNGEGKYVVPSAAVVELVHIATLYHDDVMDEAPQRRGTESANFRWGNSVAILSGDYLFARASSILGQVDLESVRMIGEVFAELVTGQMRETLGARDRDPVAHYLQTIWEKTGSLISVAARFGARHGGGSPELVEAAGRLGDAVGIAFQIVDDMIDITSTSTQSGKTPGTDLREGVHTLPVLLAVQGEDAEAERLREILDGPVTDEARVAEALDLLRGGRGLAAAREQLQRYVDRAYLALAELPPGPANEALRRLVDYTVARVK